MALGLRASSRARAAARAARSASSRAASAAATAASALGLGERGLLGLRGALGLGDQLVAAVALGQHPVLPAGRHLAQLARRRRPHAPVAGDRDAVRSPARRPSNDLHDPDVGEQPRGQRRAGGDPLAGHDVVEQRLGIRRGRR